MVQNEEPVVAEEAPVLIEIKKEEEFVEQSLVEENNGPEEEAVVKIADLPIKVFESETATSAAQSMLKFFKYIWRTFFPNFLRVWILRRVNNYFAWRSQLRLRLKEHPKIKFFETELIDREVITIDGIKLRSTHIWPKNGDSEVDHNTPRPVCIMRTLYSRHVDFPFARLLAERGYHVILQDTRGHFKSEGELNLGEQEAKDAGCTIRWLSEQPWCDGRLFLIGLSMGGYTTWATVAGMLKKTHHLEGDENFSKRKPMKVVAAFPLFSSSDIMKKGLFMDLEDKRCDPILRLDLSSRYVQFMWTLARPKMALGSHSLWVILSAIIWQLRGATKSYAKRQMHLPLSTLDIAMCGEVPTPRLPFLIDTEADLWQKINHEKVPYEIGYGQPCGDDPLAPPPALFLASGWYDIFREQTMLDFQQAVQGAKDARSKGLSHENQLIYLMMGPWHHFAGETYVAPVMRECIRVLDHVFSDLNNEPHAYEPLQSVARVTAFCMGSGGYFFHRLPAYKKLGLLFDPNNPFNVENESNHCWRYYDSWPPRSSNPVSFVLQPRGSLKLLGFTPDVTSRLLIEGIDTFVWDPKNPTPTVGGATFSALHAGPSDNRPVEDRADTLVYTSRPNMGKNPVEFAGVIKAKVWAFSSAVSADICARLTLVDPANGESIALCDGIKRITLVDGESWPKLFEVNLGNFCASIEPKWSFRLMLSGGSFPLFSRNLGYGEPSATAVRSTKARHRVSIMENGCFSEIELPIIGGYAAAFEAFGNS